jgi:hypothetical protein
VNSVWPVEKFSLSSYYSEGWLRGGGCPAKNAAYWLCAHSIRLSRLGQQSCNTLFLLENAYLHRGFSGKCSHMNDNYTPYMNRTDIDGLSAVRRFSLMTVILSIEACAMSHAIKPASDLEDSVCGIVYEPMTFWQFRWTAGAPDERRVRSIRNIARLSFTTRDGRKLGGYKLSAANPQGYLLVAQGNAMLADQIMGTMAFFLDFGLDVYVYDYRGYGLSEGKSRLKAIVSDYREIIASLNALGYGRRYLYGMSMGGVILANAVGPSGEYDAMVLDSPPSRVSGLGSPEDYDPVRNLPQDSTRNLSENKPLKRATSI